MKVTYNYVSTVTIGHFNPAILTTDFLEKVCSINLGEGTLITPEVLPFPREILFKENQLSFLIDLDRMQIKESNVENLRNCVGPKNTKLYLERLPYTPITLMGTNFNFTLALERKEEKEKFYELLNSESELFSRFKIEEFTLRTEKTCSRKRLPIYKVWILQFSKDENIFTSIRISLKNQEDLFEVNHNIEVKELKKEPQNMKFITDDYEKNLVYNELIMQTLFKGLQNA